MLVLLSLTSTLIFSNAIQFGAEHALSTAKTFAENVVGKNMPLMMQNNIREQHTQRQRVRECEEWDGEVHDYVIIPATCMHVCPVF